MPSNFDFSTYLSPFTWRYGSKEMRRIWSEQNKRLLWRKIWVELARAQHDEGLVSKEELDDLIAFAEKIDIDASNEVENEINHDLMAEVKVFSTQAKIGGGKIHLGATSVDIEDNADIIRTLESLEIVEKEIKNILKTFAEKIDTNKNLVCMGYTHLQPAEPTTLGYRLSFYAQDILNDLNLLRAIRPLLKGKGIKGAVGTSASFAELIGHEKAEEMEQKIMKELKIDPVAISGQTAPRKFDFFACFVLSSIAQSLYKFAFDVRIMQSPGFSEWQEPFGQKQVGSSAMPFKRNPIKCEQICSLSRFVLHLSTISTDNASHMLLERTLDDSANRRIFLPELFLSVDQLLTTAQKVLEGLVINKVQVEKNLLKFGPFSATESILVESVKKGANRQEMHEVLRTLSLKAWADMEQFDRNPLLNLVKQDAAVLQYLDSAEIDNLMDPEKHIGLAAKKAEAFAKLIEKETA